MDSLRCIVGLRGFGAVCVGIALGSRVIDLEPVAVAVEEIWQSVA